METTFIHTPGPSAGHRKRLRREAAETLLACKKSVILIENKDELCARAIIILHACVYEGNRGHSYCNLRKGCPIQTRLAKELHHLAGVPEGPWGIPLQKFQAVLPNYRVKVLSVDSPHCIIYHSETSLHKHIFLLTVDDHYHGCNSFGGFLVHSYFCHDCNCMYNHDDLQHHLCKGKWCRSCERKDCPDFSAAKHPLGPDWFPTLTSLSVAFPIIVSLKIIITCIT